MADSEDEFPAERDVKDFGFKQMRKVRMFESPQSIPTARSSLLAVSSKYGLTFVGCPTGLKIIKTETIEKIHETDEGSMQNVVSLCPSSFVELGNSLQFVSLSGDDLTLSVCYEKGNNALMALFDVPTLGNNASNAKFGEINLSTNTGETALNVAWNPGFPSLFAVCRSSGSVLTMELTETEVKSLASLPSGVKACAICWSPKGKQLVVGHTDGKLTQYSQTLEVKKEIECPELFTDDPHYVTDVLWISTSLFAAVYSSFEDGDCPKFLLIFTPKNEPVAVTNFDDIYYAMSDDREPVFYLRNISEWNLVVSAFSNGLEATVVGKYGGEAATAWEKWSFEEDGRPSMPLTSNNDESFPMGLAIDFSSTRQFVKGEERLPPPPIMMILSTDGVLCPFYLINQTPNTNHNLVKPPEPLPPGGQRKTVVSRMGVIISQATGAPTPAERGSLQLGPVSLGTSGNVGSFTWGNVKPVKPSASSPALLGVPGQAPFGGLSSGSSKHPSATTAVSAPSAFASPKQSVSSSSGLSGSTTTSAFSQNRHQEGFAPFKSSSQPQIPATQSPKLLTMATPQLVKPTPTSHSNLSLSGSPVLSSDDAIKVNTQPQGLRLPGDPPKVVMLTSPSPKPGQGLVAQPNTMSTQPPVTRPSTETVRTVPSSATKSEFLRKASNTTAQKRQEVSSKDLPVPVSKSNVIEASVSQNIQEAISHFKEELATLRDSVKRMESSCRLTEDNEGLHLLRERTEKIGQSVAAIRDTTKDHRKDIDEEKRKLLEAFEILEDARIRQERTNDPRYILLLKSRALDPVNTNKMREIRKLHLYLDETLREVNMVLDEQWNKENERKRSIPSPALDEIYKALRTNQRIALDQEAKLEKITEDMKTRKLLSNSWQRNSMNTDTVRHSTVRGPYPMYQEELKSPTQISPVAPVSGSISPEKSAQLRSMLQKRRTTPVRRSIIVSSTVAKTPAARPHKPQVPLLSSTPAVTTSARPEEAKNRFNLSLPQIEQEREPVDDYSESASEDTKTGEVHESEQELEQLNKVSDTVPSSSTASSGFSFGDGPVMPAAGSSNHDVSKDAAELETSAALSLRPEATNSSPAKPTPQLTATGAFSAVAKPAVSQAPSNNATKTEEASEPPSGFFLPAATEQPSSSAAASTKSEFTPGVKVISSETPPNVAAGMAAINHEVSKDEGELKKSAALSVRPEATNSSPAKPTPQLTATGAFTAVAKPAVSQAPSNNVTKTEEASKPPSVFFLPAATEQPSSSAAASTKSELTAGVKVISSGTPPNVAAGMAAMNRASSAQSGLQLASNSSLDPSASIEPVTLLTYKPQTQGGGQVKSSDIENTTAKAIANAALMAATAEAKKPSAKPQCSTEFIFKSTESGKPGPPVVTFKPPNTSPQASVSSSTVVPNVTVNPVPAFKPAFGPTVTTSSTASTAGGLRLSFSGASAASPFGQMPSSAAPLIFAPPAGGLFNLGSSSGATLSSPSLSSFSSKASDAKTANQLPAVTSSSITPSQRVSRNLFASGGGSLPAVSTDEHQNKDKELSATSFTSSPTIPTSSNGKTARVTTTSFSMSVPTTSGGPFFKNLGFSRNTGNAPGSGGTAGSSTSIMNALMQSSRAGSTGNVFGTVRAAESTNAASPQTSPPILSTGSSPDTVDTSAANVITSPSISGLLGAGGVFAQALSESSKSVSAPVVSTVSALPQSSSISGPVPTSVPFSSGGLFELPSTGPKSSVTTPSTISSASSLFGLSTGSPSSAFSATNTASAFFPNIIPPSTKASAPIVSPSVATIPTPQSTTLTFTATDSSSTSVRSGQFANATNPSSAFGTVSRTGTALGFGSLGTASSASSSGSLFGTPSSTAFAPTLVFGSSSSGASFGSPQQPFTSTVSTQGSTFGSAPVFGFASTSLGTSLTFGTKPSFGQSTFAPTTSSGFGQTASKPTENALGFGFGGFGLGGQGTSQTNKANPFIVAQGFPVSTTAQTSLFGGKSGDDVFKSSPSTGPFSQSGFGSPSSGGFSGGTFSSQGGSVLSSGFGFGAASSAAGFGSSQPFGSPSATASVFGGGPTFGSDPSFGGAPAFGGSPQGGLGATASLGVFGTGGSGVFGQSSASPSFGTLGAQSSVPSFGALAGQNPTQGFGGIQTQQHQQQPPSFGSFGGGSQSPSAASFSQWR